MTSERIVKLTEAQIKALHWIDQNYSHRARWLVDGKDVKRQPPEEWNQFEISGPRGSIIIAAADMPIISDLTIACAAPNKMYSLTDAGRTALSKVKVDSEKTAQSDHRK